MSGLRSFGNRYYGYIYEGSVVSVLIVELYPRKYLGACSVHMLCEKVFGQRETAENRAKNRARV
ncbi:hypothetical protein SPRA44_440006 [Serratia proteamaculans]|nr:hypothetical protein SPRA44_440006 [Serratia proteamaculans]